MNDASFVGNVQNGSSDVKFRGSTQKLSKVACKTHFGCLRTTV